MAKLSSAAWLIHDLGLATSIGGTLFGRTALQPALGRLGRAEDRDQVSADAWQRFSWINLASHAAFALPWFAGRSILTGREVSRHARSLTRMKDMFVIASLATGVSSILLGRWLAKRKLEQRGPDTERALATKHAVGTLGILNMLATAGVGALTTLLAIEGNKSTRWSPLSRLLP